MDKLKKYQALVQKELTYQASIPFANAPNLERQVIINQSQKHFMLMVIGWEKEQYNHYALFHFELRGDKIWVHQNNTDIDLDAFFEEQQVPKSDIVIGFLTPLERELSDYAVA